MAAQTTADLRNRRSGQMMVRSWRAAGYCCLTLLIAGCSGRGESSDQKAAAQNVAVPPPAQPPVAEKKTNRKALAKAAEESEKAKSTSAKKELTSKPVGQWTFEELKTAIDNKDPRYVTAVTMHGANSRMNEKTGGELSQLLAAVATMPGDGSGAVSANPLLGKASRKKKKDKDDEPTPGQPATLPAASAVPAAPGTQSIIAPPPPGFRLGRRREDE